MENVSPVCSRPGGRSQRLTPSPVHIQIAPDAAPSTPPWLAEVVVCAQVLNQLGLFTALQQRVRFARARFGRDEPCDVVVVLIGSAQSRRSHT